MPAPAATRKVAPYLKGVPILGMLPAARRDPLGFLVEQTMKHGPIVRMRFGPLNQILLSKPAYLKHVLQDRQSNYPKSMMYKKLWPVFGRGLVTSNGDYWRRHRRTIQPVFRQKRLAALCDTMRTTTDEMLELWARRKTSGPMDLAEEMTHVTERILMRIVFSDYRGEGTIKRSAGRSDWVFLNEEIGRRFFTFTSILEKLPVPSTVRFNRARKRRHKMVDDMIAARRARAEVGDDMLGMLISARDDETGESMSDAEIREEVMTMFFAGHETTALALAWFWYVASQHPEVRDRVEAEATRVLGGAGVIDHETIGELTYTKMVLQEVMRLYPPVPWFSRSPIEDDEIDGYPIAKGSLVAMSPWVMHRHPEYWDEPERFDPERFSPEASKDRDRLVYLPFGAGPRQCIGTHFAMMEATLVAAMIAARFRVDLVEGHRAEPEPMISLRPRGGVLVTLRPR